VSRLYRIWNGTTWGPTAWDLTPSYPASSAIQAVTFDGTNILMATRNLAGKADFYSRSPTAAGPATLLGTNTSVDYVVGLAADQQYFYVAGRTVGTSSEGVYRIPRASIATPATKIATIDTSTNCNSVELDDLVSPQHLYVRANGGAIHAVMNPAGPTFTQVANIATLGNTSDFAMTFDRTTKTLYFVESQTPGNGAVWKLE
jgi:hypothetical protein